MKLHQHNGVTYRQLKYDEIIQTGDFIFKPEYEFQNWQPVDTSVGSTPRRYQRRYSAKDFVWVREVEPLIAAMIRAKEQNATDQT